MTNKCIQEEKAKNTSQAKEHQLSLLTNQAWGLQDKGLLLRTTRFGKRRNSIMNETGSN